MTAKLALVPLALALTGAGVVAFHPGVAHASPRLASSPATRIAEGGTYSVDPVHAGVSFEIVHMGLARVHGRITKFSGKIVEDPADLGKSSVEFSGEVASLDTAVPPRDKHLQAADYFDAAAHPTLTFKSTKVAKAKEGYVVTGDLTIKGKTKSVEIPFQHYGPVEGNGGTRVGIVAETFTIKRSDFGIGGTEKLPNGTMPLSDEVTMRVSLEATKEKS